MKRPKWFDDRALVEKRLKDSAQYLVYSLGHTLIATYGPRWRCSPSTVLKAAWLAATRGKPAATSFLRIQDDEPFPDPAQCESLVWMAEACGEIPAKPIVVNDKTGRRGVGVNLMPLEEWLQGFDEIPAPESVLVQ